MDQLYWGLYNTLQNSICWDPPFNASVEGEGQMLANKESLVKDMKTNALLIFLQASCCQEDATSDDIVILLQPLIDRVMVLMTQIQATDAHYGVCWCYLIIGSHLQDKEAQEFLIRHLEMIQSRMPMQTKATELLRYLWEDPDPQHLELSALRKSPCCMGPVLFCVDSGLLLLALCGTKILFSYKESMTLPNSSSCPPCEILFSIISAKDANPTGDTFISSYVRIKVRKDER